MVDVAKVLSIQSERPTDVTILGIIYIVFGILMVVSVVMVVAFTSMMGSYSGMLGSMMGGTMAVFGGVIAVGVGILATIEFMIDWALFSGKRGVRIAVISLDGRSHYIHCVTLLAGNLFVIPHIVVDLIVFFYMWKPNVISYFNQKNTGFT